MFGMTEYEKDKNTDKIYDMHTLYLEIGDTSHKQLNVIIKDAVNEIGIKCAYKINIVGANFAYVRVSNINVYNILIGNNSDGSKRTKKILDPNFVEPTEPFFDALRKSSDDLGITDWYEISIAEEELGKKYEPEEIFTQLPPLIKLKSCDVNREIVVGRAYIYYNDKYTNNVVYSYNVPDWVTDKILRPYFSCYASENYRTLKNGKKYPLISFKTNKWGKSVYISFSDKTCDTQFSILMNKNLKINHPNKLETASLFFKYMKTQR